MREFRLLGQNPFNFSRRVLFPSWNQNSLHDGPISEVQALGMQRLVFLLKVLTNVLQHSPPVVDLHVAKPACRLRRRIAYEHVAPVAYALQMHLEGVMR